MCEVTGRSRSSSTSYGINSIRGQLLKGSTLFICIFFPTSGLSSCLPGEGNRMRLPVLFVVMWVLSVSVHVHLCGTCIPCVCLCVCLLGAQPSLSTGWTWGHGATAALPPADYRLCQPLTVWGLLLKIERYKEKIYALKSPQKTRKGYFPFWKKKTKHFKFALLNCIVNTAGTIWVWFTQWFSATVSRHLLVVLRFSTNVQRSLPWLLTALVQKCHLSVRKL